MTCAGIGVAALLLLPSFVAAQDTSRLDGVWVRGGGGGGGRGGGAATSQWASEALPFTPEGRARFDANIPGKGPRQQPPALGNDPLGDSNPPGLYRALVYNRPFEMIQLEDKVVQLFEWDKSWRVIYTDGREVPDEVPTAPFWYGYSVGRWDGDMLVVTTVGLDGRAWFDEWGTPFSDRIRVEERWRRADADTVELTLTIEDPDLFTRPWTSDTATYRRQTPTPLNGEVLEMIFAPIDEDLFNSRVRDPAAGVGTP
jgi:hypothetical protein